MNVWVTGVSRKPYFMVIITLRLEKRRTATEARDPEAVNRRTWS